MNNSNESVWKRTRRSGTVMAALAAAVTLFAAWGKIVTIAGITFAAPWLAVAIGIATFFVWPLLAMGRDYFADRRQANELEARLASEREVRDLNRIQHENPPQTPPANARSTA